MVDLSKHVDLYDLRARVQPALLCVMPLAAGVYLYFPKIFAAADALVALVVAFGGVQLLSQLARDRGKQIEPGLFSLWGGMPSVVVLRPSSRILPAPALQQTHAVLEKLTGIAPAKGLPEIAQATSSDEVYRAWSDYLRTRTRDTSKYALIFKENTNYGFRRNFLGLKSFTLFFSLMSSFAAVILNIEGRSLSFTALDWSYLLSCLCYATLVGLKVKPEWVKVAAFEYAKQLVESTSTI